MPIAAPPCSSTADALRGIGAEVGGLRVVEVNAAGAATASAVRCALGGLALRSYTALEYGGPAAPSSLASLLKTRLSPSTVRVLRDHRPTVRPLARAGELTERGADLLVLGMGAAEGKLRQSLLLDLPHALRLVSPSGLVIAGAAHPCPPTPRPKDPAAERYVGRFGSRNFVACWTDRWDELVTAGTVTPVRWGGAPPHLFGGNSSARGAWRVGRVSARSACVADPGRPPLLEASASRSLVHFVDPPAAAAASAAASSPLPPSSAAAARSKRRGKRTTKEPPAAEALLKEHLRYVTALPCSVDSDGALEPGAAAAGTEANRNPLCVCLCLCHSAPPARRLLGFVF